MAEFIDISNAKTDQRIPQEGLDNLVFTVHTLEDGSQYVNLSLLSVRLGLGDRAFSVARSEGIGLHSMDNGIDRSAGIEISKFWGFLRLLKSEDIGEAHRFLAKAFPHLGFGEDLKNLQPAIDDLEKFQYMSDTIVLDAVLNGKITLPENPFKSEMKNNVTH